MLKNLLKLITELSIDSILTIGIWKKKKNEINKLKSKIKFNSLYKK